LEYEFYDFPYIGNVIIPTDEVLDFSEGLVETTNQIVIIHEECMKLSNAINP
jgi:hypothetical protein